MSTEVKTKRTPNWGIAALVICAAMVIGLAIFATRFQPLAPVATAPANSSRIVTIGGTVTEIVYALGAGDRVIGTDTSSTFPAETANLPKAGYQRKISAEGVLSLKPTLVLATTDAGPPEAMQQLRDAGTNMVVLKEESTVDSSRALIRGFAQVLKRESAGEQIIKEIDADLAKVAQLLKTQKQAPGVLFIYARSSAAPTVAGANTSADHIISLAGGRNVIAEFDGFKPLTAEALIKANPDVILFSDKSLEGVGGLEAALKLPGIAQTNAGRNKRLVTMNEVYLLSFGPRVARAAFDLAQALQNAMQ